MAGDGARVLWGVGTLRTLRAHWGLAELGLSYQTRPVQSRSGETQTPEFLDRVNRRGKIPVLEDQGLVLAESAAILNYLADRYGAGDRLAPPPGSRARARYDQWSFFAIAELDATSLYILRRHDDLRHIYGAAPEATKVAREYFLRQVSVVEAEVRDQRPHILGERFSAADVLLTTVLDWAEYCDVEVAPELVRYRDHQRARPAYRLARDRNRVPEPSV